MEELPKPSKTMFSSAVTWILFIFGLALVVTVLGYLAGWFVSPLSVTSAAEVQRMSREANNEWQALKAKQASIANLENDARLMIALYGEDFSKWPQGKHEEYLQIQKQITNLKLSYNSECGQYRAMWNDEWRSLPAPDDLPTTCDFLE